ncbi:MAG: VanZ family protein [Candidatus Aminicenantaceae bacterium]
MLAVLALVCIVLLYYLIFKLKIRALSNYVWLFLIGGAYVYFTLKLWKAPEEAVHFLEYGLLGFFLFRALSLNVKDKSIYVTATFFTMLVGTIDEIFQWIMPQRWWDFRDVGLNTLSGGLFQLLLLTAVKPRIITEKISAHSIKTLTTIFAVCLVLLGLCASNTSKQVAYYTELIPGISFLREEESMSEFGYKHKDPEIGAFYSRLSLSKLKRVDEQRGKQNAQLLNKSVQVAYELFLRLYNPIRDPFMHELRVHLFRRDAYFETARASSEQNIKEESYFIAYKENLIVRKYFTRSVEESVYNWGEDKVRESESLIDVKKYYKSPVSAGLFTSFSEKGMWITIFVVLAVLVLINFIWRFVEKRK